MPSTHNWGTRNPRFFGCGKCRWRPAGCRGCVAASADYALKAPTAPTLAPGSVAIPARGVDEDCDREDDRRARLDTLLRSSLTVRRQGSVDERGSGVFAVRPLRSGEVLPDASVVYVARPSEYAAAHLPQYYALELGSAGYFRLREPAFGHCSLTYFVNEARHHLGRQAGGAAAADEEEPNVKYKVVRPRDGGIALALEVLRPIAQGEELLCRYDQTLSS